MPKEKLALEMRGIVKRYRAGVRGCRASVLALDGVDLTARPGECVGLLGPAASGKTTLLWCAAGLARVDAGFIRWRGQPGFPRHGGVVIADDREARYAFLTARETLDYHLAAADAHGAEREARIEHALSETGLEALAGCRLSLMPVGARRRIAIALALLHKPWLLLLDSIMDGVPQGERAPICAAVARVAASGCAVIASAREGESLMGMAARTVVLRAPGTVGDVSGRALGMVRADTLRMALVREGGQPPRR